MRHKLRGIAKTREVYLDGQLLNPAKGQSIIRVSPDGFDWGNSSVGSTLLAFSIMLELTGRPSGYADLRESVVSQLEHGRDFSVAFDIEYEMRTDRIRLVPGIGGWHIMDVNGSSLGKIVRCKGSDRAAMTIEGPIPRLKKMLDSGVLNELFTKLV